MSHSANKSPIRPNAIITHKNIGSIARYIPATAERNSFLSALLFFFCCFESFLRDRQPVKPCSHGIQPPDILVKGISSALSRSVNSELFSILTTVP